jgi:integrator complex subunit 9
MKTLHYFLPKMLVPNQRLENMPIYRLPNGAQLEYLREYNNRAYLSSTFEFSLPQFDLINVEDLDAVLISNYNTMLALPYLTRMKGFRASVYCTEPIMHFGRMLMEELTHYIRTSSSNQSSTRREEPVGGIDELQSSPSESSTLPLYSPLSPSNSSLSPPPPKLAKQSATEQREDRIDAVISFKESINNRNENMDTFEAIESESMAWKLNSPQLAQIFNIVGEWSHMRPLNWKPLYSKEDVDVCMSKIKQINYNERISIYGSVYVQPKSSAHSIGSCNWTIELDCDQIVYLARSSLLNTHSKVYNQTLLKDQLIDCLVVSSLNQSATNEPEQMIQDFCKACIMTVKNQGSVLVPVLPTGKLYDLIECLYRYLSDASLTNVPVYFISSVADQSLAYSNIFGEWLCEPKLNLIYAAEPPFQHGELIRAGFLKVYSCINSKFSDEFHQPCILFASHPSLRFGEACHFVELWKNLPNNSFIFTEPEFNYLDALAPYQPVYANYYYFPIDTSLSGNQLSKLLKEAKLINQIIISNHYKANLPVEQQQQISNENLPKLDYSKFPSNANVCYYGQNDVIKMNMHRRYENCDIESDLASMIMANKAQPSVDPLDRTKKNNNVWSYTVFNAQLVVKNNHNILRAAPRTIPLTRKDRLKEVNFKKYTYGRLNLDKFTSMLRNAIGTNSLKINELEGNETTTSDGGDMGSSNLSSQRYAIEMDKSNRIEIDLNANKVNVLCDNEELRVKIRDSLTKCLNYL